MDLKLVILQRTPVYGISTLNTRETGIVIPYFNTMFSGS